MSCTLPNQPIFNLSLARICMAGADPNVLTRTWQDVMDYMVKHRGGENRCGWSVAMQDQELSVKPRSGSVQPCLVSSKPILPHPHSVEYMRTP